MYLFTLLLSAFAAPTCPATLDTAALPDALPADTPALQGESLIVVYKQARSMGRYSEGKLLTLPTAQPACWAVALASGAQPVVPAKRRQGDMATPEGLYRSSDKPWSSFYGAIAVHYPNAFDITRGLDAKLISPNQAAAMRTALAKDAKPDQNTRLGGEILIHGGGNSPDWTLGCIALENADLDALRATLPSTMRTDILILP